ncbi:MAG TPA: hypothetical protein PLL54_06205 [Dermatophilaceae bacterium]|nr:hypothetical protein [Dermatophilaceae bacterium]
MNIKKLGIGAASAAAIGIMVLGGASFANADETTPTTSSSASATAGAAQAKADRPAPHAHTDASADETAKVTAAVTAKDSTVTVTKVQKDPDGSFDAIGTKDGAPVMVEVSADLATVEVHAGGPGGPGGKGGPGASQDTPVTGDEATKVSAAVTAKDSAVTVDSVRKDPDGSYDVLGTKAGAPVMFDVSADLATITENVRPAGGGQRGGHGPQGAQNGTQAPTSTATATN